MILSFVLGYSTLHMEYVQNVDKALLVGNVNFVVDDEGICFSCTIIMRSMGEFVRMSLGVCALRRPQRPVG